MKAKTTVNRDRFGFPELVARHFAFLESYGFSQRRSTATLVCYGKGDLEVCLFHGRNSYEIGLEIGRDSTRFTLSELIRSNDSAAADAYRNPVVSQPESMASGVARVADHLRRYGHGALRDEPGFYDRLEQQRRASSESYALDILARQLGPKADAAFRAGRYAEAADLYERISSRLGPAAQKKFEVARRRR